MTRLPRVTVACLMAVVFVAGPVLTVAQQRERNREAERLKRETSRRIRMAGTHEYEVGFWTKFLPNQNNWRLMHKAAAIEPSDSSAPLEGLPPEEDLYIMGDPLTSRGRTYSETFGEIDRERARDVMKKMAAFHEAMAEKWRRAAQSPRAPVEPDPPPPLKIDSGTTLIF